MLTDPNLPPDIQPADTSTPPEPTPPPAPAEPTPSPEETTKGNKLLQNLLGLVKPEEKDVKPAPEPTPAPATPEPPKKVAVKPRPAPAPAPEPQPSTKEIVETAVKTAIEATKPKPVEPPPAPAAPKDDDLSPEEREELALAEYAEKKDPSKKGLADQFRSFYKAQKDFLTKALAEDPDYDPEDDPKFKKWLAQNEPKLSSAERKKLIGDQIADRAAEEGYRKAKQELMPEVEQTKRKLREIEERPKVQQRLQTYVNEVATGMPAEMVEFYEKNGRDIEKLKEAFPVEFDIVSGLVNSATKIGEEFLSVRRGIKDFDPVGNPDHKFLDGFVKEQGEIFLAQGGKALTRDGKQFIPPHQWKAGMEKTHWTFDDEDVLHMIKVQAQTLAKKRVSEEQQRIERALAAKQKRVASPAGAAPTPEPKVDTPVSPKVNVTPATGVEGNTGTGSSSLLTNLLFKS